MLSLLIKKKKTDWPVARRDKTKRMLERRRRRSKKRWHETQSKQGGKYVHKVNKPQVSA